MEKLITIINRLGTKKHQLNGVELTSTAIGIELIGNFAVNSPHPFSFSYIVILQYHTYHKYTQNHEVKIIHLIYSVNLSIVRVEVTYPSYNSHNTDEIKSIIHNNIPHHI
tara:strand:- start:400 stop:729 length:330 start_codon:yes stop_codon:yes gene_type:complete